MSEKQNEPSSLEKSPKHVDVVELDSQMLDIATGGSLAPIDVSVNAVCSSNSGCNTVAGCGGKSN